MKRRVEATLHFGMAFNAWGNVNAILKQLSEKSQTDIAFQNGKPLLHRLRINPVLQR